MSAPKRASASQRDQMLQKEAGLSQDLLRAHFDYDPQTGHLTWRTLPEGAQMQRNNRMVGRRAGYRQAKGYRAVHFLGFLYKEHRLIWIWMHGPIGADEIDHENRIRDDNRFDNLRRASSGQNKHNSSFVVSRSGVRGVYWCKTKEKWVVHIFVGHRRVYLGQFDCLEQALAARRAGEIEHAGEFAPAPEPDAMTLEQLQIEAESYRKSARARLERANALEQFARQKFGAPSLEVLPP